MCHDRERKLFKLEYHQLLSPITLEGHWIKLANHLLLDHWCNLYTGTLLVRNEKDSFCTAQAKWIKNGLVHLEEANDKLRRVISDGRA